MLDSLRGLMIVFTEDIERKEIRRWLKVRDSNDLPEGYNLSEFERLASVLAEYKDKLVPCPYCGTDVYIVLQPQSEKLYVYCKHCGNKKLGHSSNIYATSYPDMETQISLSSDFYTLRRQVEEMVERFNCFAQGDNDTIAGDIDTVIHFENNCNNIPSVAALKNALCPKCGKKIHCCITEYGFAVLACPNCGCKSDKVYLDNIYNIFSRKNPLVEILVSLLEQLHNNEKLN